jgi:hypothetical protein
MDCRFCGADLSGFAVATQLVLGYDGIDYCRKCSSEHGKEQLRDTAYQIAPPPLPGEQLTTA